MELKQVKADQMMVRIFDTAQEAGSAAALDVAAALRKLDRPRKETGVIFATGASQLETLAALTAFSDLRWERVCGFQMDEYIGIDCDHPASFRHYLHEHLVLRVPIGRFFPINLAAPNPEQMCDVYIRRLNEINPQICLLGIGENGHLAFNDPGVADFNDPQAMKVVDLDPVCRAQQVAEGWFQKIDDVPTRAFTLTIPTLFKVPRLIVSVPGSRKARIVRRAMEDPISPACPATILRNHPNATLYLDRDSAAELSIQ